MLTRFARLNLFKLATLCFLRFSFVSLVSFVVKNCCYVPCAATGPSKVHTLRQGYPSRKRLDQRLQLRLQRLVVRRDGWDFAVDGE